MVQEMVGLVSSRRLARGTTQTFFVLYAGANDTLLPIVPMPMMIAMRSLYHTCNEGVVALIQIKREAAIIPIVG